MTTEPARPGQILKYAVWFGLATGLIDAILVGVKRFYLGRMVRVGPDIAWLAPVATVLAFVIFAFALIAAGRIVRRLSDVRVSPLVFGFLAALSLLFQYYPLHVYATVVLSLGIAVQLARSVGRRQGFERFVTRSLVVLVMATGALALVARAVWAVRRDPPIAALSAPPATAPNVLLIVWDTVRAQNLGLHGYRRRTTPNLERWAQSSTVFEQASSTSPWTLPSHASMFTGEWPQELSTNWETGLDSSRHPVLAEVLARRGYATGGFVANTYYCGNELGLARGFSHYEDYVVSFGELLVSSTLVRNVVNSSWFRSLTGYHDNFPRRSARDINNQFLAWHDAIGSRPFFAFLNFYDAHETYLPPPPYDEMFGPGPVQGGPEVIQDVRRSLRFDWPKRPAVEIEREVNTYDGAIAYLDEELNNLMLALQSRGVLDNTIVIVTSDHGEQFGEHGLFLHGNSLYRPLLHVPLVMRYPPAIPAGRRVGAFVSLRDLSATILELAGDTEGLKVWPGRSLSHHWSGLPETAQTDDPVIAEVRKAEWAQHWAALYPVAKGDIESVTDSQFHYIRNGDGSEELYAIATDPEERLNLASRPESAETLERLRTVLRRRLSPPGK